MPISDLINKIYSKAPTEILYHYTSLSSIINIVSSNSLWATEIHYFNDAAEMKQTADLLRNLIARKLKNNESNKKLLIQLSEWISHRLMNGHMLFVVSFTANGNLLSQWRGYCSVGSGLSIGFSPEKLTGCASNQSYIIAECIYDNKEQSDLINMLLEEIEKLAQLRGEENDKSKRHPSQSYHGVFEEIEDDILKLAALLKNSSFKEEKEWRAISRIESNYVNIPIQYRIGKSSLIPYLEFKLPNTNNKSIDFEHIYLGPTSNNNSSMASLSNFLAKSGSNPIRGITYCNVPYRIL